MFYMPPFSAVKGGPLISHFLSIVFYLPWRKKSSESSLTTTAYISCVNWGRWSGFFQTAGIALWIVVLQLSAVMVLAEEPPDLDEKIHFNIPRQKADLALIEYAKQANVTFIFSFDKAWRNTANRVVGAYTRADAIKLLLKGTGLRPEFDGDGDLTVQSMQQGGDAEMKEADKKQTNKKETNKRGILVSLIAALTLQGGTVLAQSGQGLEEVVVTAQRREQAMTDVPISMQSLSDESLARSQINALSSLATISPSIAFDEGFTLKSSAFSIRGLGITLSPSKSAQSSVSTVIDGIPLARGQQLARDLGDIERVEVLRGPQGTLFGKNSTGGVVNIVTKGPTEQLDGFVESSITTDEEYVVRGAIGGPLTDRIRGRVYAAMRDQNPTVENVSTSPLAHDMNGREVKSISGKLEFDITDDVTALFSGHYSDTMAETGHEMILIGRPGLERSNFPVVPGEIDRVNRDGQNKANSENWGGTADINWAFNEEWQLRAITGYSESYLWQAIDTDYGKCGPQDIGDPCVGEQANFGGLGFGSDKPQMEAWVEQFTQEVQLHYNNEATSIVVGGFYEDLHEDFTQHSSSWLQDLNGDFIPDRITDALKGPSVIDNKTFSVFGDITQQLTDTISVFSGLRYTDESVDAHLTGAALNRNISSAVGASQDLTIIRGTGHVVVVRNVVTVPTFIDTRLAPKTQDYMTSKDVTNLSGRIGVRWQPQEDRNYYLSYARGYKGPGADLETNVLPDEALTDPEIANAFEAGFKGRFGERFDLNIAAFLLKLDDFQQGATIPGAFPTRTLLQNIGDVRSAGVETDIVFQVTDQLNLSGSVTYLDSKYTSGLFNCYLGQTAALGCNVVRGATTLQSLEGLQTDLSPEWKYRLEGNYNRSVTDSLDGYASLAWMYQSGMKFDSNQDPNIFLDGYGLLDFAVGVASKTGRYTVEIFGKNILDKWYPATLNTAPPYGWQDYNPSRGQEAYYGMRVRVNLL